MAKKSKPESEQHAVDGDLENKKRKKKSSDKQKDTVKKSGSKKAEKPKKRKREESVDAPVTPDTTDEAAKKVAKKQKKKKNKTKKGEQETGGEPAVTDAADAAEAPNSCEADGASEEPPKKKKKKKTKSTSTDPSDDVIDKSKKGEKKIKKIKSRGAAEKDMPDGHETGATDDVPEAQNPTPAATDPHRLNGNHAVAENGSGTPQDEPKGVKNSFRRVKSEEWIGKRGSMDNTYEGTFGAGGWGFKAQQVLGQVRGKDFRHEKTKKKRGSYMGGKIDSTARFSFKYDSD